MQSLKGMMEALLAGVVLTVSAVAARGDTGQISLGERVYADKKCAMCHTVRGDGGQGGGDLTEVGAKRDADWLKQFTRAPQSLIPSASMPAFQGSEKDFDAVTAYMSSLK